MPKLKDFRIGDKVKVTKAPLYFENEFANNRFKGENKVVEVHRLWVEIFNYETGFGVAITSGELDCLEIIKGYL